ncbi:MAG: hypothetical protein PHX44_06095 [Sulfurimonas sp.]|uniref:hypothetical protein n=1 Tax=Sulfurimonas sp. TaxID=2022749 RepID=UPI0026274104|nr:hypothetical protein [Sulfurimonas sp.]MDD2652602.1 hypothetical protein [Sulfurimonas sp.]MDD3450744.1 hypothetical protein [Sulfurimonas sp.]
MRLENFLALTQASLINEPCVHSFENIVFEAHKVKRGDLFFAYTQEDIGAAVANGAYGVVFDKPTQISDNEIAWIKANSLDEALKKLIRFKSIKKEIVAYECNEIIFKLSLQVITLSNFFPIFGDLKSIFKTILEMQDGTIILFCPALVNKDIFAVVKKMPHPPYFPIEIMEQTLFETSFIYDNVFYERQLISPFFIPYLEELLHLYKTLNIEYKLRKFTPIDHFEPVFINKKFEIKNFGTSDKVLIFEPNSELVDEQILFLEYHASWANTIFILPKHIKVESRENFFNYKNEKEIVAILRENRFNFALVVGVDKSILSKPLSSQRQLTMDF